MTEWTETLRGLPIHLEQNMISTDNAFYGTLGNLVDIVIIFLYLKKNTLHLKLLNIVTSEIVCPDGHLDTPNSKICQLRKI